MVLVVVIIVVVVAVVGFGLLAFALMRRSQGVVPDVADRVAAGRERAVAVDDEGRPLAASQAGDDTAPRDTAAFDAVLDEERKRLGG